MVLSEYLRLITTNTIEYSAQLIFASNAALYVCIGCCHSGDVVCLQLTPVERYAVTFMEKELAPLTTDELDKAEVRVALTLRGHLKFCKLVTTV